MLPAQDANTVGTPRAWPATFLVSAKSNVLPLPGALGLSTLLTFKAQITSELERITLQAPAQIVERSGSQTSLHRTSSAPFPTTTLSALQGGIIRENSYGELEETNSEFDGGGVGGSAARGIQTPGHSGFAQLPSGLAATATGSSAGAANAAPSPHDASNFVAPYLTNRHGRLGQSAEMQAIHSGHATDDFGGQRAGESGNADKQDGVGQVELVPVRLASKCPAGCGCVCRVASRLERIPVVSK